MSSALPPLPQPGPPAAFQPPPASAPRRTGGRGLLLVLAGALVLSLAGNAVQLLQARSGDGISVASGGYGSPEDALTHLVENVAALETFEAAASCAPQQVGAHADLVATVDRLQSWYPSMGWSPQEPEWLAYNEGAALTRCLEELRLATWTFALPAEVDLRTPLTGASGAEIVEQFDGAAVTSLRVERFDPVEVDADGSGARMFDAQCAELGADECATGLALLSSDSGSWLVGPMFARYGDTWAIASLYGPAAMVAAAGFLPAPVTGEEYEEHLASVNETFG